MGYRYAVVGAGRQGIASAYDLAKFGEADEVLLVDIDGDVAKKAAERVNNLIGRKITKGVRADVSDRSVISQVLRGIDSFVSAVPYKFNLGLTKVAIEIKANMCDMGGHTGVVKKQLELDFRAREAGISIVPDCGMGPGMNISLAVYAMSLLDKPREVYIWDGGLPQNPEPPWNYKLTFNIGGLTNEYYGNAYFLRDGRVVEIPCFEGYEIVEFPPPLGKLEAFVTSGGLSTMPWTFEGKLERLENRTLRYIGHHAQFKAFSDLGLLELEPIKVGDIEVVPRDVFHALLEPKIYDPHVKDVGIIRVKCVGEKDGKEAEAVVELIDYYDENTGFTAMQRLTGWHASIVAILAAQGRIEKGVIPVELAVPSDVIVEEAKKRGFDIKVEVHTG